MTERVTGERLRDDAIAFGWKSVKQNLSFFLSWIAIDVVASLVFGAVQGATTKSLPALSFAFGIMGNSLQIVIGMGVANGALKLCDGKKPVLGDLFTALPRFWSYLGTSLLVCLIVIGGMLLLIVPGIYFAFKYGFAAYFSLDEGTGPARAIRRSAEISQGMIGEIGLFGLLIFGINLLGALCLLVGLFVTLPMSIVAHAYFYRKLVERERALYSHPASAGA